ncbi:hypothetical protein EFT58_06465 [Lactococcus lactis]|nr:hypothetical protein [Lactococcus lactis subsp. lactis]MCT2920244.1 hypothetical protein [Lactococcus lactis]
MIHIFPKKFAFSQSIAINFCKVSISIDNTNTDLNTDPNADSNTDSNINIIPKKLKNTKI